MANKGSGGFNFDNSYTKLSTEIYSRVNPEKVFCPEIMLFNRALAAGLGLDLSHLSGELHAGYFWGNALFDESIPIAQAYAGHQFGYFTMLGDGRAILLGEHLTPSSQRFDIQLKGSGKTPYSRNGDGRATLYSMLREYLISEAMNGFKIPTSRSLAVVSTGEPVFRETVHKGAVLTRVAQSHIRVGTFEYLRVYHPECLAEFIGYTLNRHFPTDEINEKTAIRLFKAVAEKQAELVVNWWRVGFIHGVMNTDNMSIAGETFDYGPCAFINDFNPDRVFSSIDVNGRYKFGNQPAIVRWNLNSLGMALLPEIDADERKAKEIIQQLLADFDTSFQQKWLKMMCGKLGIDKVNKDDLGLVNSFLQWMNETHADYTNSFLWLEAMLENKNSELKGVKPPPQDWVKRWKLRIAENNDGVAAALQTMERQNPSVIPRNHRVEEALIHASLDNDFSAFDQLLAVVTDPYNRKLDYTLYQNPTEEGDKDYHTFCGT